MKLDKHRLEHRQHFMVFEDESSYKASRKIISGAACTSQNTYADSQLDGVYAITD
jgi:hypothetical protein